MSSFREYSTSYNYKLIKRKTENEIELLELDNFAKKQKTVLPGLNEPCSSKSMDMLFDKTVKETETVQENCIFVPNPDIYPRIDPSSSESECSNNFSSVVNFVPNSDSDSFSSESDFFVNSDSNVNAENFSDNCPSPPQLSSKEFLRAWALKNNITHTALSSLLGWLQSKPNLEGLPKDARSLLKTPRSIDIVQMGDGSFFYFGLKKNLEFYLSLQEDFCESILDFNIDGLPIHKSTNLSFWPILCRVNPGNKIFPVALYCGKTKPPIEQFFGEFITELNALLESFELNGKTVFIKVRSFCADTPARAYIKGTKGHNSYRGCDKCCVLGQYKNRKMLFLDFNCELRTDAQFRAHIYEDYHKNISPLEQLPIDLVSSFPIDSMHSVFLGVMRKLLYIWRDESRSYNIGIDKKNLLEGRITQVKKFWPKEFNRIPRSLRELEHWKATEFRQFLLYLGPCILKNILPKKLYSNFLLLYFGIRILLCENLNNHYNEYAKDLLNIFVKHAINTYGQSICTYNFHTVIHLADDAKKFGSLNDINCFAFENFNQIIKRMLRKSNHSLTQVVHRVIEGKCNFIKEKYFSDLKLGKGNTITCEGQQVELFHWMEYKNFFLSSNDGNNCVYLKNNQIIKINEFHKKNDQIFLRGSEYEILNPGLSYPEESTFLSVFEVKLKIQEDILVLLKDILCKAILLPSYNECQNTFICSPLLHIA